MKRILIIGNLLAIGLVIAFVAWTFGAPAVARSLWGDDYKALMFKCDHVMREHYIAKRAVEHNPTAQTVRNLQASELGLVDCHAYDRLRKRMLVWGVTDEQLSLIGLEALEEKKYELRRFVEIHEIRY